MCNSRYPIQQIPRPTTVFPINWSPLLERAQPPLNLPTPLLLPPPFHGSNMMCTYHAIGGQRNSLPHKNIHLQRIQLHQKNPVAGRSSKSCMLKSKPITQTTFPISQASYLLTCQRLLLPRAEASRAIDCRTGTCFIGFSENSGYPSMTQVPAPSVGVDKHMTVGGTTLCHAKITTKR